MNSDSCLAVGKACRQDFSYGGRIWRFGTHAILFADHKGPYITNTRDIQPSGISELEGDLSDTAERIITVCKEHTTKLSDARLDLPAEPPHMLEPNLWMANAPGSTFIHAHR